MGTIGVNGQVPYLDCAAMTNASNHINSIAALSQLAGKSTGLVTTTRVTHASPSGVYAHTSTREWEADTDILDAGADPTLCVDIASQLVNTETGRNLNVIMGGGRGALLPAGTFDDEGQEGYRSDGVDLIEKWQLDRQSEGKSAEYVWSRPQLLEVQPETDYLLGLFESGHCRYNLERDQDLDPSLAEMTTAAIKVLSKNQNGFFLFVEGGRIDTAHHETVAHKALDETLEFSKAVEAAVGLTDESETLIVVTSDHAHTLSYSGYPLRGNGILGIAGMATDDLPFTTLNYAGGPGYVLDDGHRHDLSGDDLNNNDYQYPVGMPLDSETHGGDDVVVFARGPWAHLFSGVMEQNAIPHIMAYASCVGSEETACNLGSLPLTNSTFFIFLFLILLLF